MERRGGRHGRGGRGSRRAAPAAPPSPGPLGGEGPRHAGAGPRRGGLGPGDQPVRSRAGIRERTAMITHDALSGIEMLHRDECLRLLATHEIGRIGFINGDTPEILPVNYALDGDAVVFATATGTKLWSAERGTVTFEVDDIDRSSRSGWSVVIHGLAQEITSLDSPAVVARLAALSLNPWVGYRPHLVRIAPR